MTSSDTTAGKTLETPSWTKHWHLSTNQDETNLTELEFALFRNYSALTRWMDDCAACCHTSEQPCNGGDYAILNMIRMHERAKSISEVARLMNRDDISNIQYTIKKLTKAGLIEKVGVSEHKRGATYKVTQEGIKTTDRYADFRRELLLPMVQSIGNSKEETVKMVKLLSLLSGIYDQASCIAASHRIPNKKSID
jgi:predicted MarR family transcription regulator